MKKKLGGLELWQWLALGGAAGVIYYLYRKSHESKGGLSEAEEQNLLGALRAGGGAGGGTSEGSSNKAVEPAPGPVGTAGAPGPAGPEGLSPNIAPVEAQLANQAQQIGELAKGIEALNHPPTGAQRNAAQNTGLHAPRSGFQLNPSAPGATQADKEYKTVYSRNGNTYHVYPFSPDPAHRKGVLIGPTAGFKAAPAPKKGNKRPPPVHRRVTAKPKPRPKPRPKPAPKPKPKPKPAAHRPAPKRRPARRK